MQSSLLLELEINIAKFHHHAKHLLYLSLTCSFTLLYYISFSFDCTYNVRTSPTSPVLQLTVDRFSIRRGALRLLASSSIPTVARPRSVRSFASISGRTKPASLSVPFQRRWATTGIEAEGKKEEVPISEIQPTPQEEVENAISEQNAATELDGTPASTDSTASPVGANEDAVTASQEQSSVEKAVDAASTAAGGMPAFNAGGASAEFSSSPRPPREAPKPKPTIYIGNLFFDVTENDLNKEFSRFGTIQNTRLIRDARGLSKGSV